MLTKSRVFWDVTRSLHKAPLQAFWKIFTFNHNQPLKAWVATQNAHHKLFTSTAVSEYNSGLLRTSKSHIKHELVPQRERCPLQRRNDYCYRPAEIIIAHSENNMKHIITLCGRNKVNVTARGIYSYHYPSAQHVSHSSLQNINFPKRVRFVLQVDTKFPLHLHNSRPT